MSSKEKILKYLRSGEELAVAPGYAKDFITGEYTKVELVAYGDGHDEWTSEDIYNFEKNGIVFNETLLKKIANI